MYKYQTFFFSVNKPNKQPKLNKMTSKTVRFADDCGRQLTFVNMIPNHNNGRKITHEKKVSVNYMKKDMKYHMSYRDSKALNKISERTRLIEEKLSDISEQIWQVMNGIIPGDVRDLCDRHEELLVLSLLTSIKHEATLRVAIAHKMYNYN